jgi:hypothetical protein
MLPMYILEDSYDNTTVNHSDRVGLFEPTTSAHSRAPYSCRWKEEEKEKELCFEADCILLLIILGNKENMPKILGAYKPYRTVRLYTSVSHWSTALSTGYLSLYHGLLSPK